MVPYGLLQRSLVVRRFTTGSYRYLVPVERGPYLVGYTHTTLVCLAVVDATTQVYTGTDACERATLLHAYRFPTHMTLRLRRRNARVAHLYRAAALCNATPLVAAGLTLRLFVTTRGHVLRRRLPLPGLFGYA